MIEWVNDFKKIGKSFVIILSIILTLFVINQFLIFYNFLAQLNLILAIAVTSLLILGLLYISYKIWKQLHKNYPVLDMNEETTQAEIDEYYQLMRAHLSNNSNKMNPSTEIDDKIAVNEYFAQIDQDTTQLIIDNANAIFLTTAISQNGSLDSFVVLYSMLRMIWQLAVAYKTRPTLLSLGKLYVQVMSVILMTRSIEDTDIIEEQMEPLITSIIGESIASTIPGMVPISNLIVGSMMEGAVNAFLTLRVGIVTQSYLKGGVINSQSVKRSASVQAINHMGTIIKMNGKVLVDTIVKSVRKAGSERTRKWFSLAK